MTRLKGMPLDIFGDRWSAANKYVADKPHLCVIKDLESGMPMVVTKEYAQSLADLFEAVKPDMSKIDPKFSGKLLIFGTGGAAEKDNFNKLWNDHY